VPLHRSSVPRLWGVAEDLVPSRRPEHKMPLLRDTGVSGRKGGGLAAQLHGNLWTRRGNIGLGGSDRPVAGTCSWPFGVRQWVGV
jgi:hypothetical protein